MKCFLLLLICFLLPGYAFCQTGSLQQGSTGNEVKQLQNRLLDLGLITGEADGIYGLQTASAVEQAQWLLSADGHTVTPNGIADSKTLELLYDADAEDALRTLRKGSKGPNVKALQNRLIELGFLKSAADGAYGTRTENAVLAFQEFMLRDSLDGIATPDLQMLLMSDISHTGIHAPLFFDDNTPLSLTYEYVYAPVFILIDAPSGKVLLEHNADEQMYPASTTKIITLLLALEHSENLDEPISIPPSAADIPSDSSLVPVYPGEQLSMLDLLYGLMIRSGNDAANAVAELCAGSVERFVAQMNDLALQLGMTNSHFVNPHGYHSDDHYTTARDLAKATRKGLTDPVFCEIVTCMHYTLPQTQNRAELVLQNTWELFDPASEYYIPGAAGVKSGYTSAAGFCYVGAAQRNDKTLIAVVLGEPSRNRAWIDLERLFEYGFAVSSQ